MTIEEIKIKYPDIDINMDGGLDNYKEGALIVERDNIACIIKHPTENKYLISKWKKVIWNGFLTGGIDDITSLKTNINDGGEIKDPRTIAVRQEVVEETGYTDIKSVEDLHFASHGLFFHPHKLENRLAHYNLMYVVLNSLENKGVSDEEAEICDFVWIDKSEVSTLLTRNGMKQLWEHFIDTISSVA